MKALCYSIISYTKHKLHNIYCVIYATYNCFRGVFSADYSAFKIILSIKQYY